MISSLLLLFIFLCLFYLQRIRWWCHHCLFSFSFLLHRRQWQHCCLLLYVLFYVKKTTTTSSFFYFIFFHCEENDNDIVVIFLLLLLLQKKWRQHHCCLLFSIFFYDALPSSLMDPLEGPTMWKGGRSWNLESLSTFSTRGGKRGVLEVSGLD